MLLLSRRAHFAVLATSLGVGALLTLGQLPAAYATPEPVKPSAPAPIPGRYIVTLTDKPIATYGGEVKGLRATRPDKGERVSVKSGRAKRYRAYLEEQQADELLALGGADDLGCQRRAAHAAEDDAVHAVARSCSRTALISPSKGRDERGRLTQDNRIADSASASAPHSVASWANSLLANWASTSSGTRVAMASAAGSGRDHAECAHWSPWETSARARSRSRLCLVEQLVPGGLELLDALALERRRHVGVRDAELLEVRRAPLRRRHRRR